jgi:hypothetical protein
MSHFLGLNGLNNTVAVHSKDAPIISPNLTMLFIYHKLKRMINQQNYY